MSTRIFFLMSLLAMLVLASGVQAAEWVDWTGAAGDRDWNNGANWENETAPTPEEWALLDSEQGPIVGPGMEVAIARIDVGRNATGRLIVDGGVINASDMVYIASGDNGEGTLDLFSGTVNIEGGSNMNWRGKSTLNMYGGTYAVAGNLNLSMGQASTDCNINLYAGIMNIGNLVMNPDGGIASVNVGGGTMILADDSLDVIQDFIDANVLKAYEGQGSLHWDYDETNAGKTTLKAIHPLSPSPKDGSILWPGDVELSWTLPENVVKVDVWFSDDVDKILYADLSALIVDQQKVTSANVTTEMKKRYYWAVDTYTGGADDPVLGPLFSFLADNAPPMVNAGIDVDTFLIDGQRTGPLNGIVNDDGKLQPYTVAWTILEQPSDENDPNNPDDPNNVPDAVIADPAAEQTEVTLSAVGTYVLQLQADDGEYTGQDTMTIWVREDGGID